MDVQGVAMSQDEHKTRDELLYEVRSLRLDNLRLTEKLDYGEIEGGERRKLTYFENMSLIDRVIRQTTDLEEMMSGLMDALRTIFQCDQAWLLHPCDPTAAHWRVPFRSVSPEHPIHFGPDQDLPATDDLKENCRLALGSYDPVPLGLENRIKDIPVEARESAARAALLIALHPKVGRPWLLGLHQCSSERTWSPDEKTMFKDISGRMTDALSNTLFYRNLEENQARLKHLSAQLFRSQEEERKRLAQEIHDELGQPVLALKIGIENGLYNLKDAPEKIVKPLQSASNMAKNVVDKMRAMQSSLYPPTLRDFGVIAALAGFLDDFSNIYSIHVDQDIRIGEDSIPESLRVAVFRIIQEALYNAGKHSQAEMVTVVLKLKDGALQLLVEDDGLGFDPETVIRYPAAHLGLGVTSMKERALVSGGTFSIDSRPGRGTSVRCSWQID